MTNTASITMKRNKEFDWASFLYGMILLALMIAGVASTWKQHKEYIATQQATQEATQQWRADSSWTKGW